LTTKNEVLSFGEDTKIYSKLYLTPTYLNYQCYGNYFQTSCGLFGKCLSGKKLILKNKKILKNKINKS
jgi:hypothetical protein